MALELYTNYIIASGIVISFVIAAKIFVFLFTRFVLHVTSKTKTSLDDMVIHVIKRPVYAGIILLGIYFSIDYLNFLDNYIAAIRQGFSVIWILLAAYTGANIISVFLLWYRDELAKKTNSKLDDTVVPIIRKLIKAFIYAAALILVLHSFGVEVTPLLAGLGVGGLAVALALQGPLSNLFAGTFIVSDKAIKAGDYIELEYAIENRQIRGYVEEVGWRSTRIRVRGNNTVIVPNAKLAEGIIENYSVPAGNVTIEVDVGVSYLSDLEKVTQATLEVAEHVQKNVLGAVPDYKPDVLFYNFGESNINFKVRLQSADPESRYTVRSEFIKALKKKYDEECITIEWPVRRIYYGNKSDERV